MGGGQGVRWGIVGGKGVLGMASDSARGFEQFAGAVEGGCCCSCSLTPPASLPVGSTTSRPCWAIMAA